MSVEICFEVLNLVLVCVSVFLVIKELRNNTKSLRTTTRNASFHSLMEWNYYIMSDPDMAHIFYEGCNNLDNLSGTDRARFLHIIFSFFKVFENIYLHSLNESIGDNIWQFNRNKLELYAVKPGARKYWNSRKSLFSKEYQAYIDSINDNAYIDMHNNLV